MNRTLACILYSLLILLGYACESEPSSSSSNSFNLSVQWELISNEIGDEPGQKSRFTFYNKGKEPTGNTRWALFYNQTPRRIVAVEPEGMLHVEQLGGDYYRIRPIGDFSLAPGDSISITVQGSDWLIKESDAPVGLYYVLGDAGSAKVVPVTDYTIVPFSRPEQYNRFTFDEAPYPTAAYRYEENEKLGTIQAPTGIAIIPTPAKVELRKGEQLFNADYAIQYQKGLETEAGHLAAQLKKSTGWDIQPIEGEAYGPKIIQLQSNKNKVGDLEGYTLSISAEQGIQITGGSSAGTFYGIQSLLAMIAGMDTDEKRLPHLLIQDTPRFGYRGLHVDVSRNFHDKETVKRILDVMAYYKLNSFHFQLTDDEGWRLEIPALPELTSYGAYRGHDLGEEKHLRPSYGSGPDKAPGQSSGSGFYTRKDLIELLQYAQDRHIEVIPEINLPGHARAAVKSMEYRYRKLMEKGDEEAAEQYRLIDPEDSSQYLSAQHYTDNVVCVCKESVYRFYETVLEEVIDIYKEAAVPLNIVHTGGDEVPAGVWEGSPICQQLLKSRPEYTYAHDLATYFNDQIYDITRKHNLVMAGWEEVAMKKNERGIYEANPALANQELWAYVWNSLWGNEDLGNRLANAGYPVVLCNVANFYFDLAYSKDPEEEGLYWGGFGNTQRAWEFMPYEVFESAKFTALGGNYQPSDFVNSEALSMTARKNILGLQGQIWSEAIPSRERLEYMLLPKLLGLAERAWAPKPEWATVLNKEQRMPAEQVAWSRFAQTIGQKEFNRLDQLFDNYQYRVPNPGAIIEQGVLKANVAFPGLAIRYTTDGSQPNLDSPLYEGPVSVSGTIKLRAFTKAGRSSRLVTISVE